MKIQIYKKSESGYALVIATIFSAIGLFILSSALQWTSTNSKQIERNNQYYTSVAAAEASTEQVIAQLNYDFNYKGEDQILKNLDVYRNKYPTVSPLKNFTFTDATNSGRSVYVQRIANSAQADLDSRYPGLYGFASVYRIVSNASEKNNGQSDVIGAVKQDVYLTTIPLFQWAAFSTGDLEINPGKDMIITGKVHSNSNIFYQPNGVNLTFQSAVTAVEGIFNNQKQGDTSKRSPGTYNFNAAHDSGANSLNLPIGETNTSDAVHAILEIPPANEDKNSPLGKQRYYNQSDVQILLSDTGLIIRTTAIATNINPVLTTNFIRTNVSFYNAREQKTVKGIEIDMAEFKKFSESNPILKNITMNVVYVADTRSLNKDQQSGVSLINGQSLPGGIHGLTVATPNPLYVKGDYNVTTNDSITSGPNSLSTSNTDYTRPASLVADAITVLSANWNDANSTNTVDKRGATSTTVNAAILAGNVETTEGNYSGGLENFPRFLESWGSKNVFTYNGSMVMLFKSKIAKAPWGGSNVYDAPTRHWSFDQNFLKGDKLPPATPKACQVYRKQWDVLPPKTLPPQTTS